MARLPRLLLLLSFFLIPLMEANGNFGFEQIKVLFFILSISLIGFLWIFTKTKVEWSGISKAGAVFILVLLISSFSGIDPQNSLLGRPPYFQGWVLYIYLFLFFLLIRWSKIELKVWAWVLTGSAFFVGFLAIKDFCLLNIFNIQVPTYAGKVVSTFGQPNFYAGFLLLTLPFAYFLRPFGIVLGLVSMAGIFVSYSRSAILIALILLILGLIDQIRPKFKIGIAVFFTLIAASAFGLAVSSGLAGNELSNPLSSYDPDLTKQSVEKRVYIWPQAIKIVLQKPSTGYGLENIQQAFSNYFTENKHALFEANQNISPVLISLKELNIDRSHNYILDLFLFSGGTGALAWIIFTFFLFRKLIKHPNSVSRNILLVSLITYLIWIQFQNQSIVHLIYFWLLAGLIDGESNTTS